MYDHPDLEGPIQQLVQIRGRGAPQNPRNRFVDSEFVADGDWLDTLDDDEPGPRTQFLRDHTRGIIARNDSPDVPFTTSVNPYRGCEHGWLCSRFSRTRQLLCLA